MTPFNIVEDIRSRLGSGPVVLAIHPFPFEHSKEPFHGDIVGAAAHCTHTTGHVMRLQKPLVFFRSKLASQIGMQND
jgi:hypothetical protein